MSTRSDPALIAHEAISPRSLPTWVTSTGLIFFGYFLPAWLGSEWSLRHHAVPAIWPAAGIGVAGLALTRLRYWPAIALAMFAAFQITDNYHSTAMQIVLALSKALAAAAGAIVLRRWSRLRQPRMRELRDIGVLVGAGCAAALVAALAGSAVFWVEGQRTTAQMPMVFITWFLGDVVGIVVFGALLLSWQRVGPDGWGRMKWANLAATLAATGVIAWLVYFGSPRTGAFYLYPILVWAAFNLRTAGATASLAVMVLIAVAGTSLGYGPFTQGGTIDIVRMQQYLAVAALMTLLVAVVSEERQTQALLATQRAETVAASRLAELTSLYESAPIGLGFFDREYRYLRINDELAAINGVPASDHIGRTIREVLTANAPPVEPLIDRVFATGKSMRDLEVSGETPQQPGVRRHWLIGLYPVNDEQGAVEAVGIWVVEITERKRAEERERLLAREVDHRAKNLLAVVQSVVQLTQASKPAELKAGIVGRIQSLARAHSLLAESRWDGAQLGDLVREELAPYLNASAARVSVDGPELLLRPAAGQSVGMVLHELATNAAKYGALSTEQGRLEVSWARDDEWLELNWREIDGPSVKEPTTSGFGSKIMRASIERQLHGSLIQDWRPEGLQCTIRINAREALGASEQAVTA